MDDIEPVEAERPRGWGGKSLSSATGFCKGRKKNRVLRLLACGSYRRGSRRFGSWHVT